MVSVATQVEWWETVNSGMDAFFVVYGGLERDNVRPLPLANDHHLFGIDFRLLLHSVCLFSRTFRD